MGWLPDCGGDEQCFAFLNASWNVEGDCAVIISDGTNSIITAAAHLAYVGKTGDSLLIPVLGPRQDFTFSSGITYIIGGPTQLYGNTTIEAGAVIKFDRDAAPDSSLVIMGSLTCKTESYNPAILTSIDDDSAGEEIYYSTGSPQTVVSGTPYLDMTSAWSNSISNLRFCYADWGVTTPVNSARLDVWDCQFVQCNYGVVNLVDGNSTDSLHNVLFAACGAAVGASSNTIAVQGEHVTANVGAFCLAYATPQIIALTNSLIWGSSLSASSVSTADVTMNPAPSNFMPVGEGKFYLAGSSPLRASGTPGISPRLQAEFKNKTTSAPMAIAAYTQIGGQITLSPQARRYAGGAPDRGYYYDALDYTVASLNLSGGSLTVLPGTAIGFRNEYIPGAGSWTELGFFINQGGSVTSHGMPTKPNVFALADLVQETPNIAFAEYQVAHTGGLPGIISFLTDFETNDPAAPSLDFRFSSFYLPSQDMHFCSGMSWDYLWPFSANSVVFMNLQDCSLHDGQIDLGAPDWTRFPLDYVFGQGAVTWNNTLFDSMTINLDPTYYEWGYDDNGLNVDLSFEARNNLFRGGQWFALEPIPASAGNWLFEDNFFDKVGFYLDPSQQLDFDYNGYWPLQPWEFWGQFDGQLIPTVNTNGFIDGQHEQVLANAPPYQSGPFGNYYFPDTTPLYGAGSRSAGSAGLAQYATGANQTKEGGTHQVNIGLHYIAANNSGQPLDSDNDGIPDYMEDANGNGVVDANETDPNSAMTDGVTPDASNAVYLDVDLSGDGLVGRVKAALGMNPLDPSNPLTLKQIITGQEPDVATYEVPITYNALTNIGTLHLLVDAGQSGEFQECDPASDGNTLLLWNTTFDSPGLHYVQPQLLLNGQISSGATPDPTVLTGEGPFGSFNSTNICRFDPFYSSFNNNGAVLYATTPTCSNASYTIELQTPSGQHIKTVTNSTTTGIISEHWNLTDDNGNVVTNDVIKAVFHVTLLDPGEGDLVTWLYNIFTAGDGKFTVAYTWDAVAQARPNGAMWKAEQYGVVDSLLTPLEDIGGSADAYFSDFNRYSGQNAPGDPGNPGYIAVQIPDAFNLIFTNLPNSNTMNFYFDGHGSPTEIGDGPRKVVLIGVGNVASILKNRFTATNGAWAKHPYRFVFLNACDTADNLDWAHAFGIPKIITGGEVDATGKPQAFVGWVGEPKAADSDADWNDEADTYTVFFSAWMSGYNLAECIQIASSKNPYGDGSLILNFPLGKKYSLFNTIAGNSNKFHIQVYGHPGIARSGYNDGY